MGYTRFISYAIVIVLLLCAALISLVGDYGATLPVGDEIAYISKQDGDVWDIYLMDVSRGLAYNASAPFMDVPVRNRLPTWSPDGRELVFVSELDNRYGMDLLLMNPALWSLRLFSGDSGDETQPTWNPNSRIAYAHFNGIDWDVEIKRTADSNTVLIQDSYRGDGFRLLRTRADEMQPRWSPDGETLMFFSNRDSFSRRNYDIYLIDADGRNLRRLTFGLQPANYAEWSPDGNHIAFVSEREAHREVIIVNVISGRVTNLTNNPGGDFAPQWSPDGERIVFVSNRDGDEDIYVVDHDGENLRQITQNFIYDYAPQWSPDGRQIMYVSAPHFASELYVVDVDTHGNSPRRLTHNNDDDWAPVWRPR